MNAVRYILCGFCGFSGIGDIRRRPSHALLLTLQHISHISHIGVHRYPVGAVLVKDGVGGGEHSMEQERLAVAAGEHCGELPRGGEALGALGPEGMLRWVTWREIRDDEPQILDSTVVLAYLCSLKRRSEHAPEHLSEGALIRHRVRKRAADTR